MLITHFKEKKLNLFVISGIFLPRLHVMIPRDSKKDVPIKKKIHFPKLFILPLLLASLHRHLIIRYIKLSNITYTSKCPFVCFPSYH